MQNKSLKIIAFILCGSLLLGALTACGNSSTTTDKPTETATSAVPANTTATTTEPAPETVTITDGYGREVTVTKPIKTVASGISTVTELLISLGVEDRIVGIDLSSSIREFLFKDLLDLPLISTSEDSHYAMDFEKIIALEPDIFITGVVPQEGFDDIVATLEPEIPVIAVSYDTPEEFVASLTLLGELFDCQAAAAEYSAFFQGTLDMIIERVAGLPEDERPRVYYEWMQYFTFNKDLYSYQIQIDIPGGVNVAADLPTTYGMIDPEWVIEKDPEIIISLAMPYSMMGSEPVDCGYTVDDYTSIAAYRESILNRSELSEVSAIREGRVYVIQYELTATSCIGFAYMAKWLHPDLFADLDPQALHQEWLTRFMGIDYNLSEHGVFAYPEP